MTRKVKSRDARIATARALLQLAERGEPNERESAREKLDAYMSQHGLSESDIDRWHVRPQTFAVPQHRHWLFAQVATSVLGPVMLLPSEDGTAVVVPCADEDVPEITARYLFFIRHLEEEEHIFHAAFVQANDLFPARRPKYPPDSKVERAKNPPPPPPLADDTPKPEPGHVAEEPTPLAKPEPHEIRQQRISRVAQYIRRAVFHLPLS